MENFFPWLSILGNFSTDPGFFCTDPVDFSTEFGDFFTTDPVDFLMDLHQNFCSISNIQNTILFFNFDTSINYYILLIFLSKLKKFKL